VVTADTMTARVPPAATLIGMVRESSRSLAQSIEQRLHRSEDRIEEPRIEILWSSLMFVLHLTDRLAFARFGPLGREALMNDLLSLLAERIDEEMLRRHYETSQRRWSQFRELLPAEGQGTAGTLFWEFAKSICVEFNKINPATIVLLTLEAANTFEALDETMVTLSGEAGE
jgi:hypothetical protein